MGKKDLLDPAHAYILKLSHMAMSKNSGKNSRHRNTQDRHKKISTGCTYPVDNYV